MSLLAALILAQAPTVKWEALGPSTPNPKEVRASANFHHVYFTEYDRPKNLQRFVVDGKPTPWISGLGAVNFTSDGRDWWASVNVDGKKTLWVNGVEEARDFLYAYVVANAPKVRIFQDEKGQYLQVEGRKALEARELYAVQTQAGLIVTYETPVRKWKVQHKAWTIESGSIPSHFVLKDKSVLVRTSDKAYLNGNPIAGIPTLENGDELLLTKSERNWWLLKNGPRLWIGGKPVVGINSKWEPVPNQDFESAMLMWEPIVDDRDEPTAFKLFRAGVDGVRPVLAQPVAGVPEQSYVETIDGKSYAVLVELDDKDKVGIVWDGKLYWGRSHPKNETTWLCGLSLSSDGKRLAFVYETDEGQFVRADGKTYGPYKFVEFLESGRSSVFFSPDGKRFAYLALRENESKVTLYVDGRATQIAIDRTITYGDPVWIDNKTIRMMAGKGGTIFRITAKL